MKISKKLSSAMMALALVGLTTGAVAATKSNSVTTPAGYTQLKLADQDPIVDLTLVNLTQQTLVASVSGTPFSINMYPASGNPDNNVAHVYCYRKCFSNPSIPRTPLVITANGRFVPGLDPQGETSNAVYTVIQTSNGLLATKIALR